MPLETTSSGLGSGGADANLYMRVQEELYGSVAWQGGNQPPPQHYRGPEIVDTANRPQILANNGLGGGGVGIDVAGRRLVQQTSQAGFSVRRGGVGPCTMPLSQLYQAAGAMVGIVTSRPPRSYLYQVAQRVTVSTAAAWNMALTDADGGLILAGLTRPGVGWLADPAVNAGRWTPIFRLVNAGALVQGPDSNVTTANFHLLGIRYTEGTAASAQRTTWELDGTPFHEISGDANALTSPGGGTNSPFWVPEYGWRGGAAGAVAQMGPGLFEVRNLG